MTRYHFFKDDKKVKAYQDKNLIAVLYLSTNEFEVEIEMTEEDKSYHYDKMMEESTPDDYDVRAEQGLFGYGY